MFLLGVDTAQFLKKEIDVVGWGVGGWTSMIILPLRGSILQAETCKILSLAENPRRSRVWQYNMQ